MKFVESFIEKKKSTLLNASEVMINDYRRSQKSNDSVVDIQLKIIKDYVDGLDNNVRIIFQVPYEMVTSRFITIPVKNKKKAELMIPFQLEEDIPYSLTDTHIGSSLTTVGNVTEAAIAITKKDLFDEFYNKIKNHRVMPYILTYEASVFAEFINREKLTVPTCILDIGHETTKAYFFHEGKLCTVNNTYIAGINIDDAISKHYKIKSSEASAYKHKNAYLLTPSQYEDVNEVQKEFALLMHSIFNPLINEFKRWEIGYRIKYGNKISNVYITGGTSNIKNMINYLSQYLEVRVQYLDSFANMDNLSAVITDSKQKQVLNMANIMAFSGRGKSQLINMLSGEYAQVATDDLPLHSMTFTAIRMAALCSIIFFFLLIEMLTLNTEIKEMDDRIGQNFLKNPVLELTPGDRRTYQKNPDRIFKKLERKRKFVEQEIKTIQAASKINAVYPLVKLSSLVGPATETQLTTFESDEAGYVKASFTSADVKQLRILEGSFNNSEFKNVLTDLNEMKKTLNVEFSI